MSFLKDRSERAEAPRLRKGILALAVLVGLSFSGARPAHAWKPNTHMFAANLAVQPILDGQNSILIDGQSYAVDPRIAEAIRNQPTYYRGGVVGPDGFPDIFVGQSRIHPDNRAHNGAEPGGGAGPGHSFSHEWLRHVYEAGWVYYNAHNGDAAGQQALAFTYGYLTHAAGDMWGHTFVNEFARGIFPDFTDILNLDIAVRHIIVEGYIGNRTPQTDLALQSPSEFIYLTLIADGAHGGFVDSAGQDARSLGRGIIFDFFFDLKDTVASERDALLPFVILDPVTLIPVIFFCDAWVDDLQDGLTAWVPELSQPVATALFTNDDFGAAGDVASDFVTNRVLSMIGFPDFVVAVIQALEFFSDLIEPLKEAAKELRNFVLKQALGIDIEEIKAFLTNPDTFINSTDPIINLGAGTSQKLDALMAAENNLLNEQQFKALHNTTNLSSLILLDANGLDQLLFNHRVGPLYANLPAEKQNAMLGFIRSLDANHQWRLGSTQEGDVVPGTQTPRQHGEGMPIWVDCLSRLRVFRSIFKDWQHNENFPDLGEDGQILSNTPPPTSTLSVVGPSVVANGKQFVGNTTQFKVDGVTSHFWNLDEITLTGQFQAPDGTLGGLTAGAGSVQVGPLSGPDGNYQVKYFAEGLCGIKEGEQSRTFVLDQTPPTITVAVPNEGQAFDVNQTFVLSFSAADAGAGVATVAAKLDGQPIASGTTVDAFLLTAGNHQVVVTAADTLGNQATFTRTFSVHATLAGLRDALNRAYDAGLITKPQNRQALIHRVDDAIKHQSSGQTGPMVNDVQSIQAIMTSHSGDGVEPEFASRVIGWIADFVARL